MCSLLSDNGLNKSIKKSLYLIISGSAPTPYFEIKADIVYFIVCWSIHLHHRKLLNNLMQLQIDSYLINHIVQHQLLTMRLLFSLDPFRLDFVNIIYVLIFNYTLTYQNSLITEDLWDEALLFAFLWLNFKKAENVFISLDREKTYIDNLMIYF